MKLPYQQFQFNTSINSQTKMIFLIFCGHFVIIQTNTTTFFCIRFFFIFQCWRFRKFHAMQNSYEKQNVFVWNFLIKIKSLQRILRSYLLNFALLSKSCIYSLIYLGKSQNAIKSVNIKQEPYSLVVNVQKVQVFIFKDKTKHQYQFDLQIELVSTPLLQLNQKISMTQYQKVVHPEKDPKFSGDWELVLPLCDEKHKGKFINPRVHHAYSKSLTHGNHAYFVNVATGPHHASDEWTVVFEVHGHKPELKEIQLGFKSHLKE